MPVESRPLRYFVAVAQELNFARAAERLAISAPPLSRAIRKLEADLGVVLFERDTHRVALTPAGRVLLEQARRALEALDAAVARTRRAGEDEPKLVLAVKADSDAGLLTAILDRFAAQQDATPVSVRLCGWNEQAGLLRRGEADVALAHRPFDETGLDWEVVAAERPVAAVPVAHPLAGRDSATLTELDLPFRTDDEFGRHREALVARHGVRDLPQLLKLVELGEFVTLVPDSVAVRYPRPGVAYLRVPDAPPVELAVVWPGESRSRAVAALVRAAVAAHDVTAATSGSGAA
ncbi:LysR family transcriptional regulator [Actinosynnema pretiosum subsp. pretiosum]|uniref:Transcriptional regulator, LysR family n=2 Tax=Actinosynnema TaxID=40566 RepID=C6WEH4_ACTMD|nr:LysR substrate-binding domain-containing protein [Actinosynnema mirum]ACU37774.1 transcriptional regulator, LysR family [Actinosynnema mirum DSM 43827]AXX31252.1 Aromatic hydrocarbon utilization transcriptional regulator CatR (LysR family) [Actinosynnema pretiosum subsp. pretiosum]QUF04680.1 LysR family transcriptional regulator [Actinosynnema pretiosum subsp. pretiosum]